MGPGLRGVTVRAGGGAKRGDSGVGASDSGAGSRSKMLVPEGGGREALVRGGRTVTGIREPEQLGRA